MLLTGVWLQMNPSISEVSRQQQYGKATRAQVAALRANGTFGAVMMFLTIALLTNRDGYCFASKRTLLRESSLPRSTAYRAFDALLQMGVLTHAPDQRAYLLGDPDSSHSWDSESSHGWDDNSHSWDAPRYSFNILSEQTENDVTTKITNLHRAGAGRGESPSKTSKPTNIADAPSRRPAAPQGASLARRACSAHILKLSGVEITDSHKFDDSHTVDEWIVLIDEAWALRDTVLRSSEYPDFNAGKVTNYAKYRAKYRSKIPKIQRGASGKNTTESDIRLALAQEDEFTRRQVLTNMVMFGVSRNELQGRISESDFDFLFSRTVDHTAD
jgi:hypothetical protein